MEKLKVYSGSINGRDQHFVAATSQRDAVMAIYSTGHFVTLYQLREWWSVTENEEDVRIATASPGIVFMRKGLVSDSEAVPLGCYHE